MVNQLEAVFVELQVDKRVWHQRFTGNHVRKLLTGEGPQKIISVRENVLHKAFLTLLTLLGKMQMTQENKPNDCKSCMFVLLKLAENYHKLNSSVEHPGQYISQALEGECLKHKFQKPEISCLTILEQVNRLSKTERDALANLKYLNGKLSICTRSVEGCPKEYDLEKLLASGTEDRSIGDWFVNAANAVSTFFG
uniref:Uncharacterized protein n=1 Tax=Ditylenchus dipsaci TaxID=166011 RepID=A0A915DP54_9BILA